ncbi:MAG TPA: hypothetical protein VMR62_21740 [Bryobacteraceae bacterium]|nr:hypothetical protein [Bryobacteraceae bacterium]
MGDEESDAPQKEHEQYLKHREQLIDAAREGARTFDKAVLTFGSAVFGFSIAFLKDIAPKPAAGTLVWLGTAWALFALGLFTILLSFLFSQRACRIEIDNATQLVETPTCQPKKNRWPLITEICNYACIVFLFAGMLCWSCFAFENLSRDVNTSMDKVQKPGDAGKGYVVPSPPAKAPTQQQKPAPTPPPAHKK